MKGGNPGEAAARIKVIAGFSCPKDGADGVARAAPRAILVGDGDENVGGDKSEVDAHGDERGDGVAGQAAKEEQSKQGVGDGDAHDALYSLDLGGRGEVMIGEGSEKVGVDAEDDDGGEELHGADQPLDGLEADRGASTHGGRD